MTDTREIVDKLEDVIREMAVKVGRLDERSESQGSRLDSIDEKLGKQNGRIGALEKWRFWIMGGLGTCIFIVGYIMK